MILKKITTNEKFLVSVLPAYQKQRVLDFGAGRGFLVKEIRSRGIACIGCDIKEWYKLNPT